MADSDIKPDNGPLKLSDIFKVDIKSNQPKPPAYQWQDLALRIIKELNVPNFKRGSAFKVCKENPPELINRLVGETKELCKTGEKWKYFFKLIDKARKPPEEKPVV